MERRELLLNPLAKSTSTSSATFAKYANSVLPKRAAISAGLEPYTGTWDKTHARHLLRRTLFGFTQNDLNKAMTLTASTAVDSLLTFADEAIPPPVGIEAKDLAIPIGTTWTTAPYDGNFNFARNRSLQIWWMGIIAGQKFSIREKMVLFWHNQLPSEFDVVNDPRASYQQNLLLRKFAVGNFKDLIKQITINPAMLRYLNGNTNTYKNPNENYGRELQELFTIGKGVEIAAGNYTNYTEDDVKAAARVLTGWDDIRDTEAAEFVVKNHDTTDKIFSAAYGNTVIKGRVGTDGALEVDDLVSMIFAQTETAKYLCRKLYRYFVYYVIDDTVEKNIIAPMADLLKASAFEVKPVLAALLKSAHFHDALNMGCMIKNPLDLTVGLFRQLEAAKPVTTDPVKQYAFWAIMHDEAARMQMEIGNPPNVAGWPAYYQTPVFYELWINSDTLPRRAQLTDRMASAKGYAYAVDRTISSVDVIGLAQRTSAPETISILIAELADFLLPITLTAVQLNYLNDVMLGSLPDYEWAAEWNPFVASPTTATLKTPVENKLRALFTAIMELSEFQLC